MEIPVVETAIVMEMPYERDYVPILLRADDEPHRFLLKPKQAIRLALDLLHSAENMQAFARSLSAEEQQAMRKVRLQAEQEA